MDDIKEITREGLLKMAANMVARTVAGHIRRLDVLLYRLEQAEFNEADPRDVVAASIMADLRNSGRADRMRQLASQLQDVNKKIQVLQLEPDKARLLVEELDSALTEFQTISATVLDRREELAQAVRDMAERN